MKAKAPPDTFSELMLILGLATATATTSVALYDDATNHALTLERADITAPHSGVLVGLIDSLLRQAGKTTNQISVLAVATGPGSFTGLRVGMGVALGMSDALGTSVCGVPTLDATTDSHDAGNVPFRLALAPSRKGEVYAGFYRRSDDGYHPLGNPAPMAVTEIAHHLKGPTDVVGAQSALCEEIVRQNMSGDLTVAGGGAMPLAEALARRSARMMGDESSASPSPTLDYIQKPQAERQREERLAREKIR